MAEFNERTGITTYDILVVEDDKDDWILIEAALAKSRSCKFRPKWVTHLSTAIMSINHRKYDAILLDLILAHDGPSNGNDTVIAVTAEAPSTPIIVLSAMAQIEVAVQTISTGASAFVEKPPSSWRLESIILQEVKRFDIDAVTRKLMRNSLELYTRADAPILAPLIGGHLDNIEACIRHIRSFISTTMPAQLPEYEKILGMGNIGTSIREIRKTLKLDEPDERDTMPPSYSMELNPNVPLVTGLSPEVLEMSVEGTTTQPAKRRTIADRALEDVKAKALAAGSEMIKTPADARAYLLGIQSTPPPAAGGTND